MAVNKNGGYPLGVDAPLAATVATINTSLAGKETIIEIWQGAGARRRLNSSSLTANASYVARVSSGTGHIAAYNSSDMVLVSRDVSTDPVFFSTGGTVAYWQFTTSSASAYMYVQSNPGPNSTYSKNVSLTTITGSGNFGQGTGTATGGTSGYSAGEVAHVVLIGGGGGGGGGGRGNTSYGSGTGGTGAVGSLAYSNSPITLSGTYSLTIGTGGQSTQWAVSNGQTGPAGNAGNATTGFSLNAAGGAGGPGGPGGNPAPQASPGSPSANNAGTGIYNPTTVSLMGGGGGGTGGPGGPTTSQDPGRYGSGVNGQSGSILVLRWTP